MISAIFEMLVGGWGVVSILALWRIGSALRELAAVTAKAKSPANSDFF